jgi:glycosyltransferase involved in cell wall biosynthesis
MKVLYLTMNPNRASTTIPTEGWFRLLRSRGLEPVLVSHRLGAFHEWVRQQGIPAYHIPLPPPSKLVPWRFLRSLWQLRRLVKRHGIQLIHCNEQDIYPIGKYLGRLCCLPVVVSIHCSMNRSYCEWAFAGSRRPERIFFISRGNRETCRPAVVNIIPEPAWRLLPNGLDLDYYCPDSALRDEFRRQHGLSSELTIGVACALRPGKQLEHLLEMTSRLSVPGVRVLLAGSGVPGEETYADNLLRQAKQKLGSQLLHVGHLADLRGFYNALDICVNTSLEEACSITILQALACGCPVVGYPSKSVDEQVLPDGGEIVRQDHVEELAAALNRWLSDRRKLLEARRRARRRVEENYDIRELADQLWSEYESLLKERGFEERSTTEGRLDGCAAR